MSWTRPLGRAAGATGLLLLVPAMAMRFTDAVSWGAGDFLAAGALLFGTFAGFALVAARVRTRAWRIVAAGTIAMAAALVWAELAVGLFR